MRDGLTRKQHAGSGSSDLGQFLQRFDATLVVVRGSAAGKEHPLDGPKLVLGRGPGVDLALDDAEMSSQHAAIEWSGSGFRVCDLGSTNGTCVNGRRVQAQDLAAGDRVELGGHTLQLRLEERPFEPRVFDLSEE